MLAKLIVFEGADAAGKKMQAKLLTKRLEQDGYKVTSLSFPQYTENKIGGLLRECIDGKRGDFFAMDPLVCATVFAADKAETMRRAQDILNAYDIVIFDRYSTANVLHQGAKVTDSAEQQRVMQWVYELEHEALGLPKPDMVFALDVPAEIRMEFIKKRSAESGIPVDSTDANVAHQENVDTALQQLANFYPECQLILGVVDGVLRTSDDIHEEVLSIIHAILKA